MNGSVYNAEIRAFAHSLTIRGYYNRPVSESLLFETERIGMKKIIALSLAFTMLFTLSACGKSEEVKNVENLITAIGTVNVDSEAAICAAENAYDELEIEDRAKVGNYEILLNARNVYNEIPKPIELTTENYNEYLSKEVICGDVTSINILGCIHNYVDVQVKVTPKKPGQFSDLKMTVELVGGAGQTWLFDDKDSKKITLSIPTDGNSVSSVIEAETIMFSGTNPKFLAQLVSISGTFIAD